MTLDPKLIAAASTRTAHPTSAEHHDALVEQFDTANHLFEGGYDGEETVAVVFEDAWLGLGISDALDGELVVVDGIVWRVPDSGVPEVADPAALVPFAISERKAPTDSITTVHIPRGTSFAELAELVEAETHECITVRIEGTFRDVVLRSEHRQTPPYRALDEVLSVDSDQEVRFHFDTWDGILVGYRFPDARDGVLLPGLHLHALSHDRKSGGHCREMIVEEAVMTWASARVNVALPAGRLQDLLDAAPEHQEQIREGLIKQEDPTEIARKLGIA